MLLILLMNINKYNTLYHVKENCLNYNNISFIILCVDSMNDIRVLFL